jgi:hypothetical protein
MHLHWVWAAWRRDEKAWLCRLLLSFLELQAVDSVFFNGCVALVLQGKHAAAIPAALPCFVSWNEYNLLCFLYLF